MLDQTAKTQTRRIVASITKTAGQWARFARSAGCTFDVEGKAAAAVAFCMAAGGASFAIPSKLTGTSQHQRALAAIAHTTGWHQLDLALDERDRPTAHWHGHQVGRVQPKHYGWLHPLLSTGRLTCFVLCVTGTDDETKTLGCNIVFTGIRQALAAASRERAHRILGKPALAS